MKTVLADIRSCGTKLFNIPRVRERSAIQERIKQMPPSALYLFVQLEHPTYSHTTDINLRRSVCDLHLGICVSALQPPLLPVVRSDRNCVIPPTCHCGHTMGVSRFKYVRGSAPPPPYPPHEMAPSSCLISGVFPLSEGTRNADPSYYATYLSALEFINDERFINVSIRKYTASSDDLYADDSFVFMVAKAALPAGGAGMLDPIHLTPFISPPEGLHSYYPPEPTHIASITGTVSSTDDSGPTRSFTLATSEYVRDERRTFNVWFVPPLVSRFGSCL